MGTLKETLSTHFPVNVTLGIAKQILETVQRWETKRTHGLALHTAMLGIDNIYYTTADQQHLFEICNVSKDEFKRVVYKLSCIDPAKIVISDPYNIFTMWLLHRTLLSNLPEKIKQETMLTLVKLLHYKFFTSLVNYNFPFKANEAIMNATIDGLSAKFDIKNDKTSTWALVIEARSKDVIDKHSIHYKTIKTFIPDQKVLYIISDIQTRIRTKIKLIVRQYYLNKERGDKIASYGLVEEIDGEKIIKPIIASFDSMISGIMNKSLNTHTFISHDTIKLVCSLNKNLRPELLRTFLTWFSSTSIYQHKNHKLDEITGEGRSLRYVGHRILLTNIIQKTYRVCVLDKVNISSKLEVLEKTRNLYKTSRINDQNILVVKDSVEAIIMQFGGLSRESTITSLKISFILYLMILSFEYI